MRAASGADDFQGRTTPFLIIDWGSVATRQQRWHHSFAFLRRSVPVLNEDTFYLMQLLESNEPLYAGCFRRTEEALQEFPPEQDRTQGIAAIAADARAALAERLKNVITTSEHPDIQGHLTIALIDWRDIAREFIADVLSTREDA